MFAIREPSIEAIREIVTSRTGASLRYGSNNRLVFMDMFTASAITQVYDAINDENKAKLDRMVKTVAGLERVATFSLNKVR